jgi:hypothetical protein
MEYKVIKTGGVSREKLLEKIQENQIKLNRYALTLFEDPAFVTSDEVAVIRIVGISVKELGFAQGKTYEEIVRAAKNRGLGLCSFEDAVHFRLQYPDQPAGPYLTVATERVGCNEESPNGFYLRTLDDGLWLRGYRASEDYVWALESQFAFRKSSIFHEGR